MKFQPVRSMHRGSAVLDLAITLSILLSLSFGTVEYGYYFFVKNSLQGASREGARVAITPTADNTQVTQAVANALNVAGLNSSTTTLDSKFTLVLTPGTISSVATGSNVTVQVKATWSNVGLSPMKLISASKQLTGQTVMRRE